MIYNLCLDLFTFHGISSHSTSNAKLLYFFFLKKLILQNWKCFYVCFAETYWSYFFACRRKSFG